jgi:hypothetical protein
MSIVVVSSGGLPVTESPNGFPYYIADNGFGIPVTFVSQGGYPLGGASGSQIQVSNSSIPDTTSIGSTVGTLSVSGSAGAYTYSLTSNPGSLFSITGPALKTAATLSAGPYPITIAAAGTPTVPNRAFLITVTHVSANSGQPMGLLLALTYP